MINQHPQIYAYTTVAGVGTTKISDMIPDFDKSKRFTYFNLRIKDESSSAIFFVGSSDITLVNKKGISGSGDSGKFGSISENLIIPDYRGRGIKLDEYYVAHNNTATEFVLITY